MDLPSWASEDETKPAPMPLLLVQSFVNTWEGDSGADLLADTTPARRWLADAGLLGPQPGMSRDDLDFARAVRESIRALLVCNGGGPVPAAVELKSLSALARASALEITTDEQGHLELQEVTGNRLRLGRLLVIMRDSQHDGTWERLKTCHNCECRWAFYDRSHAGRGTWCDMAVCGNRMKNRKLRSRKSGSGADA